MDEIGQNCSKVDATVNWVSCDLRLGQAYPVFMWKNCKVLCIYKNAWEGYIHNFKFELTLGTYSNSSRLFSHYKMEGLGCRELPKSPPSPLLTIKGNNPIYE